MTFHPLASEEDDCHKLWILKGNAILGNLVCQTSMKENWEWDFGWSIFWIFKDNLQTKLKRFKSTKKNSMPSTLKPIWDGSVPEGEVISYNCPVTG